MDVGLNWLPALMPFLIIACLVVGYLSGYRRGVEDAQWVSQRERFSKLMDDLVIHASSSPDTDTIIQQGKPCGKTLHEYGQQRALDPFAGKVGGSK